MTVSVAVLLFVALWAFEVGATPNTRILRSSVYHNPPFETVLIGPNGTRNHIGSGRNAMDWLAAKLNLTVEFVYPSQELIKARSVEASMDLLALGHVDISSTGFHPTTERLQNAEPATFFAWEEGYRMIVPRPVEEHRLFAFVRPFQFSVWLLLLASTILAGLGMSMFSWCYCKFSMHQSEKDKQVAVLGRFGKYLTYNVNVLTNHGDYLSESRVISFSILASFWLIGSSVLVYGYSSVVVSSLTLPRTKPPVDTLEDVLASDEVSLLLRTDMYPGMLIMNFSEAPLHKALKEKMQRNPQALVNDFVRLEKFLQTRQYASPQVDTFARFYIGSQYVKERKCKFKLTSRIPSISNTYFYYFLQKGSKLLARVISLRMMELWETGIGRFWVESSLPRADECFAPEVNRPLAKQAIIRLVDLTSAFFILGVGFALSVLAFISEMLCHRCVLK